MGGESTTRWSTESPRLLSTRASVSTGVDFKWSWHRAQRQPASRGASPAGQLLDADALKAIRRRWPVWLQSDRRQGVGAWTASAPSKTFWRTKKPGQPQPWRVRRRTTQPGAPVGEGYPTGSPRQPDNAQAQDSPCRCWMNLETPVLTTGNYPWRSAICFREVMPNAWRH